MNYALLSALQTLKYTLPSALHTLSYALLSAPQTPKYARLSAPQTLKYALVSAPPTLNYHLDARVNGWNEKPASLYSRCIPCCTGSALCAVNALNAGCPKRSRQDQTGHSCA
jgi:hypothetical protein